MSGRQPRPADNRAAALWVVQQLRAHGREALFAGGCVRDQLLGIEPSDHDVATDARPAEVLQLFKRTRSVGRQFGVVLVGVGDHWIETATFRADSAYSDGRRPDAIEYADAAADARRRDFTINGMFFDPIGEQVIDLVGGREDLQRGVVRAIGDAEVRFAEDHLRLLRAVRFAARLKFDIEQATWRAMIAAAPLLRRISAERVSDELQRMLTGPGRAAAWRMLGDAGLTAQLWPGAEQLRDRQAEIGALFDGIEGGCSFALALAILTLASPDSARAACRALRTSNDVLNAATWLVEHHRDLDSHATSAGPSLAEFKKLMAHPTFDELLILLRIRLAAAGADDRAWRESVARARAIPPDRVAPPPLVTGNDLLALGFQPGPLFTKVLDRVYDAQLNETLTDRAEALELAGSLARGGR